MLVKVLHFFTLAILLWTKQWSQTPSEEPGSTGKLVVNIVKHTHTSGQTIHIAKQNWRKCVCCYLAPETN